MTTTTAHKRLDEIETHLTPTEWAVRLADEMRKYPDSLAHMKALVKLPLHELPVQSPIFMPLKNRLPNCTPATNLKTSAPDIA